MILRVTVSGHWPAAAAVLLGSASVVLAVQSALPLAEPSAFEHMVFDDRLGAMVFVESSRNAGVQRLWRLENHALDAGRRVGTVGP